MNYQKIQKAAFSVIGMEGSTDAGPGFIKALWDKANARFSEVAPLAKTGENGMPSVWGLMSDKSRAFKPWQNGFSEGLYLAGVEVEPDAQPPEGWTKWTSPAYEYVVAPMESPDSFAKVIAYIKENGLQLAGAAYDRIDPATGVTWIYAPVQRL